jgi:hypothetical protein
VPLDVSAKLVHTRSVEQLAFDEVGGNIMCWLSADHADEILQAETGQRLGIRKVHGVNWVVRESDLEKQRPTPVCLLDRTTVLFRFPEVQQITLRAAPEAEAVFRMLKAPKRDVFQFSDGREVAVNALPVDLVFDVLEVPGSENLSALLKEDDMRIKAPEATSGRKSLRERVLQLF